MLAGSLLSKAFLLSMVSSVFAVPVRDSLAKRVEAVFHGVYADYSGYINGAAHVHDGPEPKPNPYRTLVLVLLEDLISKTLMR